MILFFDSPQHLSNLAMIFRTMELLGFTDVVIRDKEGLILREPTKGWLRKANKISGGAFAKMNIKAFNEQESIHFLREYPGRILASTLNDQSISLDRFKFEESDLLIFGPEAQGITPEVSFYCTEHIHIPTQGQTCSFNVAVAAGIILFNARTQFNQGIGLAN